MNSSIEIARAIIVPASMPGRACGTDTVRKARHGSRSRVQRRYLLVAIEPLQPHEDEKSHDRKGQNRVAGDNLPQPAGDPKRIQADGDCKAASTTSAFRRRIPRNRYGMSEGEGDPAGSGRRLPRARGSRFGRAETRNLIDVKKCRRTI
jgi:hypothetical protein